MIQRFHKLGTAAAVTLAAALLTPVAFAQSQATPPQQAPNRPAANTAQSDTGPAPTDAELHNFASAATDVMSIKQAAQPQVTAAQNTQARTQVEQAAEKKMEAAVQSHHLSVQRYEQIAQLVQTDSNVRAKVQQMMPPPQPSKS